MKFLVTGASGFTGYHFINLVKGYGHEVFALKASLEDKSSLHTEVQTIKPDIVVNLAGVSFVGESDPNLFYSVNVIGVTNLLDQLLLLPTPPQRILLVSTANVYGNCLQMPITENMLP